MTKPYTCPHCGANSIVFKRLNPIAAPLAHCADCMVLVVPHLTENKVRCTDDTCSLNCDFIALPRKAGLSGAVDLTRPARCTLFGAYLAIRLDVLTGVSTYLRGLFCRTKATNGFVPPLATPDPPAPQVYTPAPESEPEQQAEPEEPSTVIFLSLDLD